MDAQHKCVEMNSLLFRNLHVFEEHVHEHCFAGSHATVEVKTFRNSDLGFS